MSTIQEQACALLAAATPGPWGDEMHEGAYRVVSRDEEPDEELTCWGQVVCAIERYGPDIKADAELIARAPEVLAALLDALDRVEALADWHETKADKARRFPGGAVEVMEKAAQVHDDAARRLRAALAGE